MNQDKRIGNSYRRLCDRLHTKSLTQSWLITILSSLIACRWVGRFTQDLLLNYGPYLNICIGGLVNETMSLIWPSVV